jgi:hypothetical protein
MKRRAGDIGDMSGKVADRPIRIEQAGLLAAYFAIAQQLHLNFSTMRPMAVFTNSVKASGP